MRLFHVTNRNGALGVLAEGFRDGEGRYMTTEWLRGVFFSNRPLDQNEGCKGNVVLRVDLHPKITRRDLRPFELVEDGKPYREWCIPAEWINPKTVDVAVLSFPFGELGWAFRRPAAAPRSPARSRSLPSRPARRGSRRRARGCVPPMRPRDAE